MTVFAQSDHFADRKPDLDVRSVGYKNIQKYVAALCFEEIAGWYWMHFSIPLCDFSVVTQTNRLLTAATFDSSQVATTWPQFIALRISTVFQQPARCWTASLKKKLSFSMLGAQVCQKVHKQQLLATVADTPWNLLQFAQLSQGQVVSRHANFVFLTIYIVLVLFLVFSVHSLFLHQWIKICWLTLRFSTTCECPCSLSSLPTPKQREVLSPSCLANCERGQTVYLQWGDEGQLDHFVIFWLFDCLVVKKGERRLSICDLFWENGCNDFGLLHPLQGMESSTACARNSGTEYVKPKKRPSISLNIFQFISIYQRFVHLRCLTFSMLCMVETENRFSWSEVEPFGGQLSFQPSPPKTRSTKIARGWIGSVQGTTHLQSSEVGAFLCLAYCHGPWDVPLQSMIL